MRRIGLMLAAGVLLVWTVAGAKEASTRPATGPAGERPPEATSAHAPPETRAEVLARARKIARLNRRLLKLAKAGRYAQCKSILEQILKTDPANGIGWYNMACVHSRLGEPDKAIECLKKALEFDYSDFRHMQRDADLDAVRKLPAYGELLKRNEQIQRARAEKIRRNLRRRFGEDYICEVDHANKLVFATNIDRRMLEELKGHLTASAEAQWRDLFSHRFEQYLTIVVRPPAGSRTGGYYAHSHRLLVATQIGMVLAHEFTHALHDADQDGLGQRHPIWIVEGLGTLFETSVIKDGHLVPQPNRRVNLLKRIVARNKTIPWSEFVKYDHARFMRKKTVSYPQCRYMMMYLYRKGLLKQWYDAYTGGYDDDRTGAKALEQVLGKELRAIGADWLAWVGRQEPAPVRLARNAAYIGVQTRGQTDGLRIVRVVPGSGAEKAGLKSGDVIINVDAQRIVESAALLRLVAGHKVADKIKLRYRRDGEYKTVTVTLGRFPGRIAASRPAKPRGEPKARPKRQDRKEPPATAPATRPGRKAA